MPKRIGLRPLSEPRVGAGPLCLNFVEAGGCYATGAKCLLGLDGAYARNKDGECRLHGNFDVWLMETNDLLITDLGFPSEEPKQCLALGVTETLAREIARKKAYQLKTWILTSERRCSSCGKGYWVSAHNRSSRLPEAGGRYLCPNCIGKKNVDKLGVQPCWCG